MTVASPALWAASDIRQDATGQELVAIQTPDGRLVGQRAGGVDRFLGIPFAQPPIGLLRWRAPQQVRPWHGEREATRLPNGCMQSLPPGDMGPYSAEYLAPAPVSEDCLYLNIWRPAGEQARSHLPVLVWIHGGAFQAGSNAVPLYDGAALARRGIIVVSINYRLGVFGFLAHPALRKEAHGSGSGNYGLQDQVAALKWVRDNIAAFGGNPQRVTIAGQSAGAMSVLALLNATGVRGLFSGAIAQSGTASGLVLRTSSQAEDDGTKLFERAGFTSLAYARKLSARELLDRVAAASAATMPLSRDGVPPLPFAPVVDGRLLPEMPFGLSSYRGGEKRRFRNDVPLLTGLVADDGVGRPQVTDRTGLSMALAGRFGAAAPSLAELYAGRDQPPSQEYEAIHRDAGLAANVLWARQRLRLSARPTYVYLFDHFEPRARGTEFGIFHSSEIPYVFGNLIGRDRNFDPTDMRISDIMMQYWSNFARYGDPNDSHLPDWQPTGGTGRFLEIGSSVGMSSLSGKKLAAFQKALASGHGLEIF